ncbi:Pollen Ole e 1 allergen and extensin family protein [Abeliophyllum distichum]|uniref:Pollen Ole e 1 allergen and extensin family protein n=1 Tax=Abeliophyllum distichum TaxID=126358 RepID=A0ABD1SVV2_9LAMI
MAKLLIFFALCLLPAIASAARIMDNPLFVKGRVYCDTCRCGYETSVTKYIPGARVKLECRARDTLQVTYMVESVTDSTGSYNILVQDDRGDEVCDAVLVKSSDPECAIPNSGWDRARVILTRNNGMNSDIRFANAMGFLKNEPLASCAQILQKYQETED